MIRGRREFVKAAAAAGAGAALASSLRTRWRLLLFRPPAKKILILGGRPFSARNRGGRESARPRSHDCSTGGRPTRAVPRHRKLHETPNGDLKSLEGRSWTR